MSSVHIYLVPGFFGFTSLGAVNYFHRVSEVLDNALRRRGHKRARIFECPTQPTGSIRNRADRLLEKILETGGLEADEIHLVGHSTGGLDVRLLVTPGVRLRPGDIEERVGRKTRSVITVSTPHFGTPLANHFTTLHGRNLLYLLTLLATTTGGRYSLFLAARSLSRIAHLDDFIGRRRTFLDNLSERLLRDLSPEHSHEMWAFLGEVSRDQGAIIQLTPEGMHLFNAAVVDRSTVSYRCVLTAAPPPPTGLRLGDLARLYRILGMGLFSITYFLAAREHRHYPYPSPLPNYSERIEKELPFPFTPETNDGVVPILSQVYGTPAAVVVGDHLDVVGQFHHAGGQRFSDWLPSGSAFDEERFGWVWDSVAKAITAVGSKKTRTALS